MGYIMSDKRIARSQSDRIVAGVAGGVGTYLNIDPLYVRIGFLVLSLFQGLGIILYLALWVIVPNEGSEATDSGSQVRENINEMRGAAEKVVERVRNAFQSQNHNLN
ncbi:MAG: PspC domain-containing protein [Chloroflexi bacterium AL-W]|nr:PspC domain-containing protein [Chloroflexi bacterium AL-N1]NOK70554.1 PspC domain-containing protein [Chloroflexi bacterium AL-N10]NOK77546.1 PspC domain-containing protein [Chloroflexi bacterium AL-N5]NOK84397.1 PspC domain-containing protein [Chloroflexi bacterium AL-W]NOK92286.1 PspC domain-containing protein [Chloroflexi bacterium AL-N15]